MEVEGESEGVTAAIRIIQLGYGEVKESPEELSDWWGPLKCSVLEGFASTLLYISVKTLIYLKLLVSDNGSWLSCLTHYLLLVG